VIAVDTNILVHAHRAESPWHDAAVRCLRTTAQGPWAIPWPCVHEFLAIVTHPRIFSPPSPVPDALRAIEGWLSAPTVTLLAETEDHWDVLRGLVTATHVSGARVHDARIAGLCQQHGVTELLSADRDFSRFARLRTRNPLA
jgi:uncharacterized protein